MRTSRRRTVGAGISLGAIVAVPATAQADDIKVTNLNDSGAGSLRQAILDANDEADSDRILFKSKLSGRIELTSNQPLQIYSGDLTIKGPGARKLTVDANGSTRVFGVYSEVKLLPPIDVTISGLTATGGNGEGYLSGLGGGIFNFAGDSTLTLKQVTITGNTSEGPGGGVHNYGGNLTIDSSTISGNLTRGNGDGYGGGGVYNDWGGDLTMRNSTISGNTAERGDNGDAGDGGGVYAGSDTGTSTVIRHSTITGNHGGGEGGGLYAFSETGEVGGTIIARNSGLQGNDVYLEDDEMDFSFDLIQDPDGQTIPGTGNLLGADPKLKPLKNNGGPTDTHAFKKSPAKNKVPKGQSEKKDQRGAPRKGKGDIGAYELVKCEGVIVNRVGTAKKDKLKGTRKADGILGLGGNDKLSGKKGKDGLCGGKGKDTLKGGPGKDKLDGGPGKDKEIQ